MDKKMYLKWIVLILFAVSAYSILQNLNSVLTFLTNTLSLFTPFMVGGAIAFILNVPMKKIESLLFNKGKKENKYSRPLALVLTLIAFVGAFYLIIVLIVPSLEDALSTLPEQIATGLTNLSNYTKSLSISNSDIKNFVEQLALDWDSISKSLLSVAQNILNKTLASGTSLLGSVATFIVNSIIAFIFAIYILLQKEKLAKHFKMIAYALFSKKVAKKLIEIANMSNDIFSKFLSGQCLEALILGAMFVISMLLFRMPYAVLIGVLVSITALIPLVGAFIACVIGFFLIALISPMQALGFLALFLVLQQVEGNLVYPYVVGNSVGLPSIWVLVASYVGANLIGLIGIIVAIPLSSIFYTLFREFIYNQLKNREVSVDKI